MKLIFLQCNSETPKLEEIIYVLDSQMLDFVEDSRTTDLNIG
jgi:hypothetical protein